MPSESDEDYGLAFLLPEGEAGDEEVGEDYSDEFAELADIALDPGMDKADRAKALKSAIRLCMREGDVEKGA